MNKLISLTNEKKTKIKKQYLNQTKNLNNQNLNNQNIDNQNLDNQNIDNQNIDNQNIDNQNIDNQKQCLNSLYKEFKFNINNQISMINNLYLNNDFREKKELIGNLSKKINSYKQQDIKKQINNSKLICLDELIQKLVESKLLCYYCNSKIYLFYINCREKLQWTLDRIDNKKNHSNENTLICCLDCNLKRRVTNKDYFLFTKQLVIKKN